MPSAVLDAVNRLYEAMNNLVPPRLYPSGVQPLPTERISGSAFFPGGSGLYLEDRDPATIEFPVGGVMLLGHNFDSEEGFTESVARGKEQLTTGTWGPLLKLLEEAGVPLDRCFFTNAFMGLCKGGDSFDYRGREPGAFRAACSAFLKVQIEIHRPRLIVTLGRHVPPMLAELSPDLTDWTGRNLSLATFDAVPISHDVGFLMSDGSTHRAVVVPLAHPSMPNNSRRKPRGFPAGRQGEVEVVRTGWARCTSDIR